MTYFKQQISNRARNKVWYQVRDQVVDQVRSGTKDDLL
jgi:hypothetical protein